eukprot:CAMPEP_0181452932 /NCGR_PEP_ID=MMETSP1110-20121109/29463_1 /TAXON_ID=174948 /ORGANISM="Symbiodinium sp., Strain CCMP421" /LENGTH=127 /DNA_ID=CAMNT_0023577233 /DNA_START=154 /DNA_END=533 /DNA_ORIENTATION=-
MHNGGARPHASLYARRVVLHNGGARSPASLHARGVVVHVGSSQISYVWSPAATIPASAVPAAPVSVLSLRLLLVLVLVLSRLSRLKALHLQQFDGSIWAFLLQGGVQIRLTAARLTAVGAESTPQLA